MRTDLGLDVLEQALWSRAYQVPPISPAPQRRGRACFADRALAEPTEARDIEPAPTKSAQNHKVRVRIPSDHLWGSCSRQLPGWGSRRYACQGVEPG
jgi:hypothetical protein